MPTQGVGAAARVAGAACWCWSWIRARDEAWRDRTARRTIVASQLRRVAGVTVEDQLRPHARAISSPVIDDDGFIARERHDGARDSFEDCPSWDAVDCSARGRRPARWSRLRAPCGCGRTCRSLPRAATAARLIPPWKTAARAIFEGWQPSFVDGCGGRSVLPTMWPLRQRSWLVSIVVPCPRWRRPLHLTPSAAMSSPRRGRLRPWPRH